MRSKLLGFGAVLVGTLLSAPVIQAQRVSPFQFGIGGGVSVPTGDLSQSYNMGWDVQAMMGMRLPAMPLGLRADVMYHRMGGKDLPSGTDSHYSMLAGTANAVWQITPGVSPVRPYVIGGVGVYRGYADVSSTDLGSYSESETNFGLNGGAGLSLPMAGRSAFVEARVHNVFGASTDSNGDKTSLRYVPVVFGITF